MEDYKAYLLGPDGHIAGRIDLMCEDDCDAKERARMLAQDCPVELFRGLRKIAEFAPEHDGPANWPHTTRPKT